MSVFITPSTLYRASHRAAAPEMVGPVSSPWWGLPITLYFNLSKSQFQSFFFFFPLSHKNHQMKADKEAHYQEQSHRAEAREAPGLLCDIRGPGIRQTWGGISGLLLPGHTTQLRFPPLTYGDDPFLARMCKP